ncbi:MAG TPA: magnesium transporter [Rhodospirillaceae bacterium]|nr:magnesium transporter [Rhodospirillaceae bacterium]
MVAETLSETLQFELSAETLNQIETWLEEKNLDSVVEFVRELHASDFADLIEKIDHTQRAELIRTARQFFTPEVFEYLSYALQETVARELDPKAVAQILSELDSDDALNIIAELEEKTRQRIMHELSATTRAEIEEGLAFPENSAGRLMQREVVAVPQFWTVGKTLDYLRAASGDELPEDYYAVFAIDALQRVSGRVPISRLLSTLRSVRLLDIMDQNVQRIPATMDQEEVAFLFRRYALVSTPVVDADERLLGVITVDDVVEVIDEEASEDILKLASVGGETTDATSGVWITAWHRFGWLFINLLTAIFASRVISLFSGSIEKTVALAALAPIVASMGGNTGTQTLAVAVRALATKELTMANAARVVFKEAIVGGINGAFFAVLLGMIAGWIYNDIALGIVIGLAMIINLISAGFLGAMIPIALTRFRFDPAVGSSVVLTTFTDCIGFFVFLGLASLFVVK